MKLLVNTPAGTQEIIEVGEGGGYFDLDRVLWDERGDGPLPTVTLGGMKRVGKSLVVDQPMLNAHNAAKQIAEAGEMQRIIVAAMDDLFDSVAQSRRYDNRITCALRAGYVGPYQAEGKAFATWMDSCNALAYSLLIEVQTGKRPMPATIEEGLALLPEMVWPT